MSMKNVIFGSLVGLVMMVLTMGAEAESSTSYQPVEIPFAPGGEIIRVRIWEPPGKEAVVFTLEARSGGTSNSSDSLRSLEDTAIQGLGEFVVKRAKAEAVLMMRESIYNDLCSGDTTSNFLPNLCSILHSVGVTMSYEAIGVSLQEAAKKDLERLPDFILFSMIKDNRTSEDQKEALSVARIGLTCYMETQKGRSAMDLIAGLSEIETRTFLCDGDTQCMIPKYIKISAKAIYLWEKENHPLPPPQTNPPQAGNTVKPGKYTEDAKILYALILNTLDPPFENADLEKYLESLGEFRSNINTIIENTDDMASHNASPASLAYCRVRVMAQGLELVINVFDKTVQFLLWPPIESLRGKVAEELSAITEKADLLPPPPEAIESLQRDSEELKKKMMRLESLQRNIECLRQIMELGRKIMENDYAGIVSAIMDFAEEKMPGEEVVPRQVRRYIPLLVEIASAKTSADVARALEAAAAPVGSYREKFERRMFSISAIFAAGGEWRIGEGQGEGYPASRLALFVPVGVHFSWPLGINIIGENETCPKLPCIPYWWPQKLIPKTDNCFWRWQCADDPDLIDWRMSWGLFVSLLDFGPYLYMEEGDLQLQEDLTFEKVFSPGIFGTCTPLGGNGRSSRYPLIIGAGVSLSPRFLNEDDNEKVSAWRFQIFLGMDLTLFAL